MSEHQEDYEDFEDGSSNTNILELIMRDYLPYWPVVLVAALLGLFAGNTYLKTQVAVYEVGSNILLKDETQQSTDALLKQAVTGVNQTNINSEIEIIKSGEVMKQAVIKSGAQISCWWDGRVRTQFENIADFPLSIEFDTLLVKDVVFSLGIADKSKSVLIDGKKHAVGQWFKHNGNNLRFKNRQKSDAKDIGQYKNDANHTFYVSISSLDNAIQKLSSSFSVSPDKKKEFLLKLSTRNTNSSVGAKQLRAIIEAYQTETKLDKQQKNRFMMEFIDERLALLGDDLDSIESNLINFQRNSKLDIKKANADLILKKANSRLEGNEQIETQLFMLGELEKYLDGQLKEPIMIPPAITGVEVEILNSGFMELYTMEREYASIKDNLGKKSEKAMAAENAIALQKKVLLESISNARKTLLVMQKRANSEVQSFYNQYESMMGDLPAGELSYLEIKKQLEIKNGLYTFLLQQREQAAIQIAGITSDIKVVKAAGGGDQISPKPLNILVGFTGGMVALVLLVLFVKSSLNNKLLSRKEIENRTSLPVVGEVIQTETDTPLIMSEGNRTLIAEQFRSLRTNLSYLGNKGGKSKLLVSSSFPGEGKSFVSTNIAIGYALAGKKTVIIESDLRKPNIAKHFKLSRRTGLSVYLSGNAEWNEVFFDVEEFENLYVIPAGPIPPNPVELILNGRYEALLEKLGEEFDHVIIDCPPVGLVTDAYEIGNFVDYALFITRHRYTPREAVSNILERLNREKKFKQAAIILNGMKSGISGYGYDSSYGY